MSGINHIGTGWSPQHYCPCPDCRRTFEPKWPCGRPRYWDTPVPMPPDYPLSWPVITCGGQAEYVGQPKTYTNHDAMSGIGETRICN